MRISFFDPPQPHFRSPCPRCQGVLVEQIRNKYQLDNPGSKNSELNTPGASGTIPNEETLCQVLDGVSYSEEDYIYPDEVVTPAPRQLCQCCETIKLMDKYEVLCGWCIDCPTGYCDIPTKERMRYLERS